MIAVGVGVRANCSAAELLALIDATLGCVPVAAAIIGLFSIASLRGAPCLASAAAELGVPLAFFERAELRIAAARAHTVSERIEALLGLPSVAETAALAGAGVDAVLLVPRRTSAMATCAIAGPERLA